MFVTVVHSLSPLVNRSVNDCIVRQPVRQPVYQHDTSQKNRPYLASCPTSMQLFALTMHLQHQRFVKSLCWSCAEICIEMIGICTPPAFAIVTRQRNGEAIPLFIFLTQSGRQILPVNQHVQVASDCILLPDNRNERPSNRSPSNRRTIRTSADVI